MERQDAEWKIDPAPKLSRVLRYQMQTLAGAAILRFETTLPGDLEMTSPETRVVDLTLLPENCRMLAEHLRQCADLLERHKSPMN